MNAETFSEIASGIQSLVVAAAALAGGVWALYRFGSLKEVEKARAELERVGKSLLERGIFDIQVKAKQLSAVANSHCYVVVNAVVHNSGNRTEVIDWSKSGIYVTHVSSDAHGHLQLSQTLGLNYVVPGKTSRHPRYFRIREEISRFSFQ
jgi:hypothetical protein